MLFNSFDFFVFLPSIFILYWFVFNKSKATQNILLLIASYFFYSYWSWKFMLLLLLSTALDFLYGFGVANANRGKAKLFLLFSVLNNVGILFLFKYYDFFAHELQFLFNLIGLRTSSVYLQFILPVGISFYTFHGMSYVFDIYQQKQKPVANFVDYALFVSFFPLLVAGPIERANHLLPQIREARSFRYSQAVDGCKLILWGLFKKVVIADSIAVMVDKMFDHPSQFSGESLLVGAITFSFQIYADFSGYSDIALGTAKLFGFELLSNFRFPYFSRNIAEFWKRWHISLSSWFRDYLYIPLGGSRRGLFFTIRNTIIIFVVSGFWHGASWKYVTWGAIHACLFLPTLLLNRNRNHNSVIVAESSILPNVKEIWQMGTTFISVTLAWIFFRAQGLQEAMFFLKRILAAFFAFL